MVVVQNILSILYSVRFDDIAKLSINHKIIESLLPGSIEALIFLMRLNSK